MNPFEVERLGWDEIRGLPARPRPRDRHGPLPDRLLPRGLDGEGLEEVEAIGSRVETDAPAPVHTPSPNSTRPARG